MTDSSRSPAFAHPKRAFAPWAVSIALHGAVVVGAFFVVWNVTRPVVPDRPRISASFENIALAPIPAPTDLVDPAATPPDKDDLKPSPTAPIRPLLADLLSRADSVPSALPDPAPLDEVRQMIAQHRVPVVRFAGLGASNARDVVYVVDGSGSMLSAFPQVIDALASSLGQLGPTQRFQVILFGPGERGYVAAHHPADPVAGIRTIRLIRATAHNVSSALTWARSQEARGRSNPISALRIALGLDPDVVFVLSSTITGLGQWEPDKEELLAQIDELNPVDRRTGRRRVLIKTIQLFEADPSGILRAIGRAHGGEDGYKFLSRQELLDR